MKPYDRSLKDRFRWMNVLCNPDFFEMRSDAHFYADMGPTSVYFITDGSYVKIGVARDIKKRIKQLQTGNPKKLILLMKITFSTEAYAYAAEGYIHGYLQDAFLRGEWYKLLNDDRFFYLFLRQKPEEMTAEAFKLVRKRIEKKSYLDHEQVIKDQFELWKMKFQSRKRYEEDDDVLDNYRQAV